MRTAEAGTADLDRACDTLLALTNQKLFLSANKNTH
jgi:cell division GTPase FtsZ